MPLRLLHVSQPVDAGVPTVVAALAAAQVRVGHEVHVACPAGPGLAERAIAAGASHHTWDAGRTPGRTVPAELRQLRRVIDAVDPDVVVLHSAKAGLVGRLAVRGRRRTVYVPHAWSFEAVSGSTAALAEAWEVLAARWTDVVVCVSADEARRGRAVGVTAPTEVLGNGVDLDAFRPASAAAARARLGLADRPTVVCVGRLVEQKGQDLLLAAWPAVRAAVPEAQLVLVGDGPARTSLEDQAGAGVVFAGNQPHPADHLVAADVVAVPSRWEGGPLVPLEAMATGRPVVGFAVDGMRAAVGETGLLVEPLDVAALSAALTRLLRRPEEAAALGRAARERVEEVADLAATLRGWEALLTSLSAPDRRDAPLRVLPARSLTRFVLSGATARADVAQVDQRTRGAAARATALSALGVPVWWRDAPAHPPAPGAPVLTGDAEVEDLARAARRPGVGTPTRPAVTVVVTVLNEGPLLRRVVDDVLAQLSDGDELMLVDGGSTDGSVAALPAHPALRVETVPGAGISAGRNHGIAKAAHEVIVCTDAGCVPEPGFIEAFRRAFAVADPPALVSGVYAVLARDAMERAQALACYPQPREVRRPDAFTRAYTRVFGTGFDPRFAVGRCLAFTRTAWSAVGGFPEHLATGEDVSFGLAVAEHGACLASADAVVGWTQRDGLAATWRMYRGYGRASTDGGHRALLVRDGLRGAAYVIAPLVMAWPAGRRIVGAGAAAYLSLPVLRALRDGAGPATVALLPVALATKDIGKLAGAVQGIVRQRRSAR